MSYAQSSSKFEIISHSFTYFISVVAMSICLGVGIVFTKFYMLNDTKLIGNLAHPESAWQFWVSAVCVIIATGFCAYFLYEAHDITVLCIVFGIIGLGSIAICGPIMLYSLCALCKNIWSITLPFQNYWLLFTPPIAMTLLTGILFILFSLTSACYDRSRFNIAAGVSAILVIGATITYNLIAMWKLGWINDGTWVDRISMMVFSVLSYIPIVIIGNRNRDIYSTEECAIGDGLWIMAVLYGSLISLVALVCIIIIIIVAIVRAANASNGSIAAPAGAVTISKAAAGDPKKGILTTKDGTVFYKNAIGEWVSQKDFTKWTYRNGKLWLKK